MSLLQEELKAIGPAALFYSSPSVGSVSSAASSVSVSSGTASGDPAVGLRVIAGCGTICSSSLSASSLYFTVADLATYTASRADLLASAEKVFSMVGNGAIKVDIRQRYTLAEAAQAHRDLEAGETKGPSILLP